jgi:hypothetical protein
MAKQGGMGDRLFIQGFDYSGDVQALGRLGGGPAPWDTTDITQSGISRLGLVKDAGIDMVTYFDDAVGKSHPNLKLLPYTDVHMMYCRGTTLGNASACMIGKQLNYDGTRGADGSFTFAVQSTNSAGYPLEWGRLLTAGRRVDGSAGNGTSVDLGAASPGAFGLQMYVQLFAFTGTSVTIKIQESSDNAVGDPFADVVGATTAALTAVGAVRIATGAINVERYLRVTTTGTFSNADFAVMATRNDTAIDY